MANQKIEKKYNSNKLEIIAIAAPIAEMIDNTLP